MTRPSPIPPITIPGGGLPGRGETIIDRATLGVIDPRLLTKFLVDPPPVVDLTDGAPTRPIVVDDTALQRLVREALVTNGKVVVWTGPGRELLVRLGETRAAAVAGGVGVGFDVESGNGRASASVMLTVARAKAPAGMIASAGAVEISDELEAWSEAIVAAAWQAVLSVAVRLCSQAGLDRSGASFVPAGIYAEPGHLGVVPRARHKWER